MSSLTRNMTTLCPKKTIPNIFSCNLNNYYPSLIIFCTYITKRISNQKLVYILTSPE